MIFRLILMLLLNMKPNFPFRYVKYNCPILYSRRYCIPKLDKENIHKLPRIHFQGFISAGNTINFQEDDTHYLTNVMRLKNDALIRVFNENNGEYLCHIQITSKKARTLSALVKEQLKEKNEISSLKTVLYFAPIKKPRLKTLIEKITEIGATNIIPVNTQNTNNAINDRSSIESYNKLLIQGAEQSERLSIPILHDSITFKKLLEDISSQQKTLLICKERSETSEYNVQPLLKVLQDICFENTDDFAIFIGPEGGFSTEELGLLNESPNTRFVSLGRNVLRAETAAISALSLISGYLEAKF